MNSETKQKIAHRFGVSEETVKRWVYHGLLGRRSTPTPNGRGRPDEFVVTEDDIENFNPPKAGRPKVDYSKEREQAAELAKQGLTNKAIAEKLGVPEARVRKWVPRKRQKNRPRGAMSTKKQSRLALASALYAEGVTCYQIAKQLNVSFRQVYRWRDEGLLG